MESSAAKHMKIGLLCFVGGFAFTLLTYSVAKASGAGMYIAASGAVFFGALQFLYGTALYVIEKFSSCSDSPLKQDARISEAKSESASSQPNMQAFFANRFSWAASKDDHDIVVQTTDWIIKDNHLLREYEFRGLLKSGKTSTVQIRLTFEKGQLGAIHTFVDFLVEPFPLPGEIFLIVYLGSASDDPDGYFVSVRATPAFQGCGLFIVVSREDVDKILTVLMRGRNTVMKILDKQKVLSEFPIANDIRFRISFNAGLEQAKRYLKQSASSPDEA